MEPALFRYAPPDDRPDEPAVQHRRRRATDQPGGFSRRRTGGTGATVGTDAGPPGGTSRHALRRPSGKFTRRDGGAAAGPTPPRPSPVATSAVGYAPTQERGGACAPTRGPPATSPSPQARRGAPAVTACPRPHDAHYEFVDFLDDYSARPVDLPSRIDDYRPRLASTQRAHQFALQLSLARAVHSGHTESWNASIPFVRDTGEDLREQGIFLSWVPVLRTDSPQILEGYKIYHRLARRDIE